ncbi:MAG: sigma-70 family RNA polymerase sigma factor [Anaerolineales bacterium]|nr:sigma-70 family RNA polymerase sigma factor [Anaerolineales bacterium]MCL4260589.1 sigma-70 family RNA polymerase sigma factor [Anaerolineales bacterium]
MQNEAIGKTMTASVEDINWDSVVKDELPRLYNYFRYRLGDESVAEELTSTVLEKAWTKRHRYRKDRATFSTWLFAIARNEVITYLRKRRITLPISMAEEVTSETTEKMAEQSQDLSYLSHLLADLPEREREIISLKFGADLNNREISTVMKLSESNVGTILSRALQKLLEQMEGAK